MCIEVAKARSSLETIDVYNVLLQSDIGKPDPDHA
jgi:hypothetical protein